MIYKFKIKYFFNSFYRRKLPDIYIRGTSQEGKIIFKQALQQGNMECYFPLIQQFTTQIQPQTCGPTSLVMVLNSLGVDPNKTWKGIWRWYTEENLNLMTKQILKSGLKLSNWTHIARHNHLDVSTFYYPKFDNTVIQNLIELNQQCEDCKQPLKTASYQTFRDCILSSARRQGFILTLNHSRKKLLQTGIGHYSPIGGYNKKRNLVLMLDVARFKYPTYWCDIKSLYESLQEIDEESKLPRGFILVSKQIQNRSEICNGGLDYSSIKYFHSKLIGISQNLGKISTQSYKQFIQMIIQIFDHEVRSLLVYFLFQLSNGKKNQLDKVFKKINQEVQFKQINRIIKQFDKSGDNIQNYQNLKGLINDFMPSRFVQIIYLILISMPHQIINVKHSHDFKQQIKYFRKTFGIFKQKSSKKQNFL